MTDTAADNGSFAVAARIIGPGAPVFVVAEVGINHGGDPALCARMIEAAAGAGADAVKLQTIDPEESYVEGTASYKEFRGKELDDDAMVGLMRLAARLGVILFSTPGDFASLERMVKLGMPAVKISSGLMTNLPLIAAAARHRLPLIISTGLAYEAEIAAAVQTARDHGAPGIALLKCTALYPSPDPSVNLAAIPTLAKRFGLPVGYSDHTLDDLACTAAVALGATVIEKHFTLDRSLPGADHHISLEPEAFADMVAKIRRLQAMRGDGLVRPVPQEEALRRQRHRCLVARCDIAVGEAFTTDNVALKRPLPGRDGLPPSAFDHVMGSRASRPLKCNDPITDDAVARGR